MSIDVLDIDAGDQRNNRDDDHRTSHGVVPHERANVAPANVQGLHQPNLARCDARCIGPQDEMSVHLQGDLLSRWFIQADVNHRRRPDARAQLNPHGDEHDHDSDPLLTHSCHDTSLRRLRRGGNQDLRHA